MVQIPDERLLVERAIEDRQFTSQRGYLGYSQVGHDCARYLFFTFRWCYTETYNARMARLFDRGHQEESVVVRELLSAGMQVEECLSDQSEVVGGLGHIKGHPDGIVYNVPDAPATPHLLEIKTAKEKYYKEVVRFGLKRAKPVYWTQIQCYMHKKKLTRTLYIITNKNTDERFYARYHYDPTVFQEAEDRAMDIITSDVLPLRISERPEWYECKWCAAWHVCHGGKPVDQNCRTCRNVRLQPEGEWHCSKWPGQPIPEDFQHKGCTDYVRFL